MGAIRAVVAVAWAGSVEGLDYSIRTVAGLDLPEAMSPAGLSTTVHWAVAVSDMGNRAGLADSLG
jgi:hypothetical protein